MKYTKQQIKELFEQVMNKAQKTIDVDAVNKQLDLIEDAVAHVRAMVGAKSLKIRQPVKEIQRSPQSRSGHKGQTMFSNEITSAGLLIETGHGKPVSMAQICHKLNIRTLTSVYTAVLVNLKRDKRFIHYKVGRALYFETKKF